MGLSAKSTGGAATLIGLPGRDCSSVFPASLSNQRIRLEPSLPYRWFQADAFVRLLAKIKKIKIIKKIKSSAGNGLQGVAEDFGNNDSAAVCGGGGRHRGRLPEPPFPIGQSASFKLIAQAGHGVGQLAYFLTQ